MTAHCIQHIFAHWPFLADDVVDVLEGIAQHLKGGTDRSSAGLLSCGDDPAVFFPAAQTL